MANFCQKTSTSLNALVEWMSTNNNGIGSSKTKIDSQAFDWGSNRPQVPDILILLVTSLYQPSEHNLGELLIKPHAPLHVFIVSVGSAATTTAYYAKPLAFAATTAHLAVKDFDALDDLVAPLCQSVQSFLSKFVLTSFVRIAD